MRSGSVFQRLCGHNIHKYIVPYQMLVGNHKDHQEKLFGYLRKVPSLPSLVTGTYKYSGKKFDILIPEVEEMYMVKQLQKAMRAIEKKHGAIRFIDIHFEKFRNAWFQDCAKGKSRADQLRFCAEFVYRGSAKALNKPLPNGSFKTYKGHVPLSDKLLLQAIDAKVQDTGVLNIYIDENTDCDAQVGMIERKESGVHLGGSICSLVGTIKHELLHSLGFLHEHTRPGRGNYVSVSSAALSGKRKKNFMERRSDKFVTSIAVEKTKRTNPNIVQDYYSVLKYDYKSIMHYRYDAHLGTLPSPPPGTYDGLGSQPETRLTDHDVRKLKEYYPSTQCASGNSDLCVDDIKCFDDLDCFGSHMRCKNKGTVNSVCKRFRKSVHLIITPSLIIEGSIPNQEECFGYDQTYAQDRMFRLTPEPSEILSAWFDRIEKVEYVATDAVTCKIEEEKMEMCCPARPNRIDVSGALSFSFTTDNRSNLTRVVVDITQNFKTFIEDNIGILEQEGSFLEVPLNFKPQSHTHEGFCYTAGGNKCIGGDRIIATLLEENIDDGPPFVS